MRSLELEQHYDPKTVGKLMSVCKMTVLRACERGKDTRGREGIWPWYRLGQAIRIPTSSVERWKRGGMGCNPR